MSTIIGKGFKSYVKNQIDIRQKKLGLTSERDDSLLKYITNKTSWIRLTSGVDIDQTKVLELGINPSLAGPNLAKQYQLFSSKFNNGFTSNIGYSSFSTSYGFNSTPDYGLVPPPGIKSIDIKSLNRGSLREANIQITCHNLQQFKILETLYLRLGYSIFLEWGHTLWYDNDGNLRNDAPNEIHTQFLNGVLSQENILDEIEKYRDDFQGNYDGFFGVVVNFDWDLRNDGGYDINIRCKSVGDIIESLKLNIQIPISNQSLPNRPRATQNGEDIDIKTIENIPDIIKNYDKSTLHYLLFIIKNYIDSFTKSDNSNILYGDQLKTSRLARKSGLKAFERPGETSSQFINDPLLSERSTPKKYFPNYLGRVNAYKVNFSRISENDESTIEPEYYISLGTLLRIIENFLGYLYSTNLNSNLKPLFNIDYDFDRNICFTIPRQLSVDPTICLIPSSTQSQIELISEITEVPNFIKVKRITKQLNREVAGVATVAIPFLTPIIGTGALIADTIISDSTITSEILISLPPGIELNKEYKTVTYENLQTVEVTTTEIYYDKDAIPTTLLNPDDENIFEAALNIIRSVGQRVGIISSEDTSSSNNILTDLEGIFRTNEPFVGKTMDIMVNLNYIISRLDNNLDFEGKISIYTFLKDLMQGIQTSLGSINNFEIVYTSETNTFNIIDNTFIPGVFEYLKIPKPDIAKFNPNLLKPNYGSFTNSVSIKSQLDNKFTAMITIGAQANGNRIGENATAFSKWNQGLTDRAITVKQTLNDPAPPPTQPLSSSISPEEAYINNLTKLFDFRNKINAGIITSDDIDNNKQSIIDLFKYEIGYYTQKDIIPGIGFIPLNLQLDLDGLSGIRIYEVYTIDDTLLPDNYKNNIQFITKGVSHKVDNNRWVTTLESISGPKPLTSPSKLLPTGLTNTPKPTTTDVRRAEELLNNEGNCPKTFYSDKPVVPYKKTTISDEEVMRILKNNFSKEVALATFTVMKNEQPGPNGVGFKAFNNNYGGVQTDSSRWSNDSPITGRLCLKDGSGEYREFASFDSAEESIKFKGEKIKKKGLYIGGTPSRFKDNPYYKKTLSDTTGVATSYGYEWIRSKAGLADGRWQRNPFVSFINSRYQLAENIYNRV